VYRLMIARSCALVELLRLPVYGEFYDLAGGVVKSASRVKHSHRGTGTPLVVV